ncbi:MAG: RIP metalloprotease RseP [Alphaproteobacteria bacterium]|nr:RIP metalloprotease RseP [Alphaproteobacteria bacterium]
METLLHLFHYLWSFVVVLSVVVFVHEFGHYVVAKLCGVKIEAFSIGFGPEIAGFNDRSGTRWKLSWLPLGGYVKMFGDASAASNADFDVLAGMTEAERRASFHYKKLPQKAAVVMAGPLFNFLLTIGLFTYFIFTTGLPSTEPVVGEVMAGTPAASAGFQPGDRIVRIEGHAVKAFNDIIFLLSTNVGTPVKVEYMRAGEPRQATLTPAMHQEQDALGNAVRRPIIGIRTTDIRYEDVGLPRALKEAVSRTYLICASTLKVVGQIITGQRGTHDLKGPIGIAQLSGQATAKDAGTALWLIAVLSANLGLINLLPVPVLDGGHLAYYTAEALRGRPLAKRVQDFGYRIGFALVIMLMVFTLFNDIRQLFS